MSFQNKTVIITGASRGIGKAIGLKLAAAGANIVIASKSVEENPKLGGTIFSAAAEMEAAGGRMDALYFCSGTENSDPNRKPNPGMAYQAKDRFPEIDFAKCIMVGNTKGDMEFGRNIGAFTVYIHTREDKIPSPDTIDARFDSLYHLAKALHSR